MAEYLWSPIDDRGTASLRRGGFVILGKLATSELGALPVTEPPIHPPTRNPWDLGVTPGGSLPIGAQIAGRLGAGPGVLLPDDPRARADAMGLLEMIAGEDGLGWNGHPL